MKKATKFELTYLKKEKVAEKTYSFYFDRKNLRDFDFSAGQYLKLRIETENPDERGTSRYFTISSSPTDRDFLTITTRIIKSSFKLALAGLKPGDKLNAFGPIGYFDFDPKNKSNIFLAGGIGVTPYHSILRFLDSKEINSKITLFASFPYKREIVFFDEFKKIEKEFPSVKIIYTLTRENLSPEFEYGRINEGLIKKYVHDFKKSKFFITGPEETVNSLYDLALKMGIPEEQIFKEDFPGY